VHKPELAATSLAISAAADFVVAIITIIIIIIKYQYDRENSITRGCRINTV
jgi:hypothetical protein